MKIVCVGRNYAAHVKELGNALSSGPPLLFLKGANTLVRPGGDVLIPRGVRELHHEVELVLEMGEGARVARFGVGLDMTARCLQREAKERGEPWTLAKAQDTFAPLGELHAVDAGVDLDDLTLWCSVNGEERQRGNTSMMLWSVERLVGLIDSHMSLQKGDLIFTGTPEGVSRVLEGDVLRCGLEGYGEAEFHVKQKE